MYDYCGGVVDLREWEAQGIRNFDAGDLTVRTSTQWLRVPANEHHTNLIAKATLCFEGVDDGATDGWVFTMNEEVEVAHDHKPDYFPDYEYGGGTSLAVPWSLPAISRILNVDYWHFTDERSPSGEMPRARPLRWEDSEASSDAEMAVLRAAQQQRLEEEYGPVPAAS